MIVRWRGTYIFPLPDDAAISNFSMYVDGKKMEGRILSREEARRIYEETVRKQRDPALLEYAGRGAFQASVYPIPAKAERRVQIEYTQVLGRDSNLVRYIYPLSTEKFSPRPLQQLSIHVTISGKEAIKAVYSSSHDVAVARKGDFSAEASFEAANVRPRQGFRPVLRPGPGRHGRQLDHLPPGQRGRLFPAAGHPSYRGGGGKSGSQRRHPGA